MQTGFVFDLAVGCVNTEATLGLTGEVLFQNPPRSLHEPLKRRARLLTERGTHANLT